MARSLHPLLHSDVAKCRQKQKLPTSRMIRISPLSASNATLRMCCFSEAPWASYCQAGGHNCTEEWRNQTYFGGAKALFLKTHLLLLHCLHWGHPCYGGHFFLCLTQRAPWFWSSLFSVAVFQVLSAVHKVKRARKYFME